MDGIPWLASSAWAYPALEVVHIAGIALLVGNLLAFELRVWGVAGNLPLRAFARLALGLALAGFALVAASGALMFAANPEEILANRLFGIKMGLVLAAGLNAAWFHLRGSLGHPGRGARLQSALSLTLWLAAMACGRFMAYQ